MELCEAIGRMRAVADGPLLAVVDADALRVLLSAITRATTMVACAECGQGARWRYAVKGMCPDCAAERIDRMTAEDARLRDAMARDDHELGQVLGRALGYPRYADDQANFPGATGDDVCTGPHVAVTLAMEAAERIAALTAERDATVGILDGIPNGKDDGR